MRALDERRDSEPLGAFAGHLGVTVLWGQPEQKNPARGGDNGRRAQGPGERPLVGIDEPRDTEQARGNHAGVERT